MPAATPLPTTAKRVALIAGEASGDLLGADLINALQHTHPEVKLAGIGGPRLQAVNCECWWDYHQLAVFGLVEVLKHLPRLLKLRKQLLQRLLKWQPDVVITIDAPDFNLPLAAKLKQHGIPVVHYVCPSIWAWRQNRVHSLARSVDHVLCLLPFERDFLQQHKVAATFTGHPLADQINAEPADRNRVRQQYQIPESQPVIALLPGSRDSELKRLLLPFLQTIAYLKQPVTVVTALTKSSHRDIFKQYQKTHLPDVSITLLDGHDAARTALQAADAALLASGTVTLEAMLCGCPMVVAYRLQGLTWQILKQFNLYKAKYVCLPNLLADEALVPEILQNDVKPKRLANELQNLLDHDQSKLRKRFAQLSSGLRCQAGQRAADVVAGFL